MSQSVDERIVQMQFDNKAFESGVSTTLGSLGKLNDAIDGLSGNGLSSLGDNIDGLSDRFSTLGIIGMTAIQNITNRIVDMGLKFASSMSIDQISAGFDKYTQSTKNVKALLNSTGEDIEYVSDKLNSLSWYSDATSYSYTAMVGALKSFSAQDIKMDESIPMIMGIGNSLSYAGLAAEEASGAFEIYSKAIGQGYLSNIQWKSLNNMGAATAGLKKQFIEAALAAGTLKKSTDGTITTLNGLEVSVENFDSTLSNQKGKWLTTDVMQAVFGDNYGTYTRQLYDFMQQEENMGLTVDEAMKKMEEQTGIVEEFGKKAFLSAQEARTFSEAVGAIKDAASSAWQKIFENVFGNAEEATEMWTAFSNWLYDVFMGPMERLSEITSKWKELGGREEMLQIFRNLAAALDALVKPLKEAFGETFEKFDGQKLLDITNKIKEFTEGLTINEETSQKLHDIFKGLFSVIDFGKDVLGTLLGILGKILNVCKPLAGFILDIGSKIANLFTSINDSANKNSGFTKFLESIGNGFSNLLNSVQPVTDLVSGLFGTLEKVIGKIKEFGKAVIDNIKPILSNSLGNGTGILTILGGFLALKSFNWNVLDPLKAILNIKKALGVFLDDISASLETFTKSIKIKSILEIAIAVGILAGSLLLLSSIKAENLAVGLGGLAGAIAIVEKTMNSIGNMNLSKSGTKNIKTVSFSLIGFAAGMFIMAVALKKLASLDLGGLAKGLIGIGLLMQEICLFMKKMDGTKLKVSSGLSIILLATGLLIMTQAVKSLGQLDIKTLAVGLGSVAILLGEIVAFSKLIDPKGMLKVGIAMIPLATGLLILTAAVKILGGMSVGDLAKGLISMGVALGLIAGAMKLLPKSSILNAAGLLVAAVAIDALALALKVLGTMDLASVGKSLLVLGGALAELSIALHLMKGTMGGAAALLIAALAINAMAPALMLIGSMSLGSIAKSLIALAGALAILGIAATVLGPLLPAMLGLAGVMVLFGIGVAAFGAGMAILSVSALAGAAALVGALQIILTAIPNLVTALANAIGAAIIALCTGISESIPTMLETLGTVLLSVLTFLVTQLPQIIDFGVKAVLAIIQGITDALPQLVEAGANLVITFIESLANTLETDKDRFLNAVSNLIVALIDLVFSGLGKLATDIIPKAIEIVGNFVTGFVQALPKVVQTIADFVKKIINGISELNAKFREIAINCITGFINGIKAKITDAVNAVKGFGSKIVGGLKNILGINSPSKVFAQVGEYSGEGYIKGLKQYSSKAVNEAEEFGDNVIDAFSAPLSKIADLTDSDLDIEPTITPVLDLSDIQNGSKSINGLFDDPQLAAYLSTNTGKTTEEILGDKVSELGEWIRQLINSQTDNSNLGEQIREALEGVGVYMNQSKVGKLVSNYQSNVSKASSL